MKESRKVRGQWRIYGPGQSAYPGTLRFEPEDDIALRVRIPRDPGAHALTHFLDVGGGSPAIPPVIHGACEDGGPVTLFGCGYRSRSATSESTDVEIRCLAALINSSRNSWADQCFRAGEVEYSLLNNWIGQRFISAREAPDGKASFVLPSDVVVNLAGGARLCVSSGITRQSVRRGRFGHSVFFHFANPLDIETIVGKYSSVFQNLLCLLTGRPIFHDRISLYEADHASTEAQSPRAGAELLQCCSGVTTAVRDLHGAFMPSTYAELAGEFPGVVRKWFELHERLEPVIGLFMLVRSHRVEIMQTRFLLLAQALEVYHARSSRFTSTEMSAAEHKKRVKGLAACVPEADRAWLEEKLAYANQKTLAARISEVLCFHTREAAFLTAEIPGFAEKVKHTRNYYTHYGGTRKSAEGRELIRISVALEGLIGACLLKEIGIVGKPLERFLGRYCSAKLIDLEGAYPANETQGVVQSNAEEAQK